MWIYQKKRPPFPSFQLVCPPPLQCTPSMLAQKERGDEKARVSEVSDLERAGKRKTFHLL